MKTEREYKFIIIVNEFVSFSQDQILLGGYSAREEFRTSRDYFYYDTLSYRLKERGITVSLRLRENDCVLTYKIPIEVASARNEEELVLTKDVFEQTDAFLPRTGKMGAFLNPIYDLISGQDLVRKLASRVQNTRIPIFRAGKHVLELTLSEFSGTDGIRKVNLYEAEVELQKSGAVEDLEDFCRQLERKYSLTRITANKYQRMVEALDKARA